MKYHTLFFSKIGEDVAKFVVCCSRDWCLNVGILNCNFMKATFWTLNVELFLGKEVVS